MEVSIVSTDGRKLTRRSLMKSTGILATAAMVNLPEAGWILHPQSDQPHAKSEKRKSMAVTGISSIWLPVTDWQRAKKFYENVLGLHPMFVNDATGVAAYSAKDSDPPLFLIKKPGSRRKTDSRGVAIHGGTVGFNVDSAEEIMKHVVAFGGAVSDHISDGTDTKVFTIFDPDGNVLELTEMKKPESGKS